jgi:AcrR family transcriptional regulator
MVVSRTALVARNRILDATATLLLSEGADKLTILAVAREAGISKGGLFYHFPSKHALIEGLLDRLIGGFDAALSSAGSEPGAATRAYLRDGVSAVGPAGGLAGEQLLVGLLGAAIVEPSLMAPLRERYMSWQARLDADGLDPSVATLVRMAVDGWWLADAFDLAPPDAVVRVRLSALLNSLIEDSLSKSPQSSQSPRSSQPLQSPQPLQSS